jgi:hypothetical protein
MVSTREALLPIYLTPYVFILVGVNAKGDSNLFGRGQLKLFQSIGNRNVRSKSVEGDCEG